MRTGVPMKKCAIFAALTAGALVQISSASDSSLSADQFEFFERKIRPVLVAECYECHAAEKQKGGLSLNSRAGLLKGGDSGPAIVPGDPEKSLLIGSIKHLDPDLKMPKKAPKLDEPVIADFVAWIKMGAPDPRSEPDLQRPIADASWSRTLAARRQWWCFQPLANLTPPQPKNGRWSQHPVDRFLLARMEERQCSPAAAADSHALVRRLSFAITGLPPTYDEVQRFVRAAEVDRQSAVAEAVDRLLASPAFGERWARHWMDLVRYAETYGSEHDYLNPYAWRYRDYLIRAFNADLPYDRFVQEQIAGDLLEPRWNRALELNEARLGTAWHRMIESYATPVDVKREEVSVIDWQIEALGKTFLGLTIQCARCHDHKFDPISAKDFYGLYGVFASTRPILNILDDPRKLTAHDIELLQLKDQLRQALALRWADDLLPARLEAALKRQTKDVFQPLRALAKPSDFEAAWHTFTKRYFEETRSKPEFLLFADFTRGELGGWRASGPGLPDKPAVPGSLSLGSGDLIVRAIQPAGFFSDTISERHAGSLRSPEFIIEKTAVSVLASGSGKARLRLVIENFQNDLLLFSGVNPDLDSSAPRWITMPIKPQWIGCRARVELLTRDDKTCVGHTMDQAAWAKTDGRSSFGIQQVVFHDGAPPARPPPLPVAFMRTTPKSWSEFIVQLAQTARAALARWAQATATDEDACMLQALLEAGVLKNSRDGEGKVGDLVAQFRTLEQKIPLPTRAPGVCDDGYGYDSPLFPRGDHTHPAAGVPRHFPEVLGGASLAGPGSGRLALAREITRRDNPLTARVMVNRIWQHLFGRGLVGTPDNFGKMGEKPTHPELLDYLTHKFMDDDWSVKRLIRHIVTSHVWQLSAEPSLDAFERDPGNDLLSHANARRLDGEAIRDAMLAVAGNLQSDHCGPGVRLFYRTQIDPDKQPPAGPIDGEGRRSIYLEARRLFPSDFLAVFDAPKPNIFTGRRSETNVPAQSLTLMNDPFVHYQANVWAKRVLGLELAPEQRVTRMYVEAFARVPAEKELASAMTYVNQRPDDAWRDLAHALFNMKEFIYPR
jgi:hypothetical protein